MQKWHTNIHQHIGYKEHNTYQHFLLTSISMNDHNINTLLQASGLIENMSNYLYHGSKQSLTKLKKRKAIAPPGRPPEESLEAIYLTPDFLFALACACQTTRHVKYRSN